MKKSIMERYTPERFREVSKGILAIVQQAATVEAARKALYAHVSDEQYGRYDEEQVSLGARLHIVRDCARAWRSMLTARSDQRTGFSNVQALWDLSRGISRPDLQPGFYAEMIHMALGLRGKAEHLQTENPEQAAAVSGREAAVRRSDELDRLWVHVEKQMSRYEDGLTAASQRTRSVRRARIQAAMQATDRQFADWRWQVKHIARNVEELERMVSLLPAERESIRRAANGRLPFGVTPYYASLLDEADESGRDRALRAQVIPPPEYVERMLLNRGNRECAFDFMLERDTSPIDLVTRRYPAIAILKPYNTCPQICVYCQRNWEIDEAMSPNAIASPGKLDAAIRFIAGRPALREILVTGGDPLSMDDDALLDILGRLAEIPHIEVIRIGTRTPVTIPMRITQKLAKALGRLREPGRRELCIVTHIEHPYEITPDLALAVDRLRRQGISIFNQLVYSFYVSRRFEAAKLRMVLRRVGIEPYYTFMPKGKEETNAYRVPLARLLQEQKEEARLLPGSRRTDEPVYNVPGLGKNYLRAFQHRDLLAVMPDGARVYDFHPWEKGIADRASYVGQDVPLLQYLCRLEEIGEDPDAYESLWYYY
ncbi:MAG: KamA family radical SAM protein [Acidobacteriota bacterium]|nr:KamA family radical SAM protein [Acidobacteriota bacterium]